MTLAATAVKTGLEAARKVRLAERLSENRQIDYGLVSKAVGREMLGVDAQDLDMPKGPEHPEVLRIEDMSAEDAVRSAEFFAQNPESSMQRFLEDRRDEVLRTERNPSKMPADTARRIVSVRGDLKVDSWGQMNAGERLSVLEALYKEMADEACIPPRVIAGTGFTAESLNGADAATSAFVSYRADQGIFALEQAPQIAFEKNLLENPGYGFEEALCTLYHETMHVMQQQCLTEAGDTFAYAEQKMEWAENVKERLQGNNPATYMEYLEGPMETFAHEQDGLFQKMYQAALLEA